MGHLVFNVLSLSILISFLLLNDNLAEHLILSWWLFSLSTLKYPFAFWLLWLFLGSLLSVYFLFFLMFPAFDFRLFKKIFGAPGWLSWLSIRLWLRSWSHGLWVGAPCQALCCQFRAWSLLQILWLALFLPLACSDSVSVSVSVSKTNKHF